MISRKSYLSYLKQTFDVLNFLSWYLRRYGTTEEKKVHLNAVNAVKKLLDLSTQKKEILAKTESSKKLISKELRDYFKKSGLNEELCVSNLKSQGWSEL